MAAGPITLVPLLCFNAAARHLPYTTLGFLQYIAPTLVLLLAVQVFGEHLAPATLVTFIFIWRGCLSTVWISGGIGVSVADQKTLTWLRSGRSRPAASYAKVIHRLVHLDCAQARPQLSVF